jgi:hypothetical protein
LGVGFQTICGHEGRAGVNMQRDLILLAILAAVATPPSLKRYRLSGSWQQHERRRIYTGLLRHMGTPILPGL